MSPKPTRDERGPRTRNRPLRETRTAAQGKRRGSRRDADNPTQHMWSDLATLSGTQELNPIRIELPGPEERLYTTPAEAVRIDPWGKRASVFDTNAVQARRNGTSGRRKTATDVAGTATVSASDAGAGRESGKDTMLSNKDGSTRNLPTPVLTHEAQINGRSRCITQAMTTVCGRSSLVQSRRDPAKRAAVAQTARRSAPWPQALVPGDHPRAPVCVDSESDSD